MIDKSLLTCEPSSMPNHPDVPNPITTKFGTHYTFHHEGVSLTRHNHDDATIHYTLIVSGVFKIEKDSDSTPIIAKTGDMLDFNINDPHSITCIEPGVVWNGRKNLKL